MSDSPNPTAADPTGQSAPVLQPPSARGSLGALLLFAAAVLAALVSPWCTRDTPVSEDVTRSVAEHLQAANPRAFILVHPPWRTDVESALQKLLPGRQVGPALPPDAMDGKRPVMMVLWPHAPRPGALSRFAPEAETAFGDVVIRAYNGASRSEPVAPPALVQSSGTFSLPASLRQAQVKVVWPSRTVECNAWDGANARWNCTGMDEWNFVGPVALPIGGEGRRCIWAHPTTDAVLSMTFKGVQLGSALRLGHGLRDGSAGIQGASDLDVVVSACSTQQKIHHANAPGWMEDRIPTEKGQVQDVTLDITAAHDGARHFCIWLEVEP